MEDLEAEKGYHWFLVKVSYILIRPLGVSVFIILHYTTLNFFVGWLVIEGQWGATVRVVEGIDMQIIDNWMAKGADKSSIKGALSVALMGVC